MRKNPEKKFTGSSGTRPKNGIEYSFANFSAPPDMKISVFSPQQGQINPLIFSTIPKIGSFILLQKLILKNQENAQKIKLNFFVPLCELYLEKLLVEWLL